MAEQFTPGPWNLELSDPPSGDEKADRAAVEKQVRGTFGGRFRYFGGGRFEYVAYTD